MTKSDERLLGIALLSCVLASGSFACVSPGPTITEWLVPDSGRMPQLAVDRAGTLHLMYFRGAMTGGDVYYAQRTPDATDWSTPIRVNSNDRSAIGMGPMDGGDLALGYGPDDTSTLHAAWFGNDPLRIFYSRTGNEAELGFERQRVIWEASEGIIEARPTIAADDRGQVWVAWHAGTAAGQDDAHRAVYLVRSVDGGDTFSAPEVVSSPAEGACGCCSPEAFSREGRVWVSYRGAADNLQRGQRLLSSTDGVSFVDELIHPWSLGACPVTTTTFAAGPDAVRVAWETDGDVYFAPVDSLDRLTSPDGAPRFRRKNPAIATNGQGDTILAWGDAPGYRAGGTLAWQVFDADGNLRGAPGGGTKTIASGSGPAVVETPDNGFVIVY